MKTHISENQQNTANKHTQKHKTHTTSTQYKIKQKTKKTQQQQQTHMNTHIRKINIKKQMHQNQNTYLKQTDKTPNHNKHTKQPTQHI